jgi:flagellar biosynthesis/type III secretory pathway protein FliH
MGDREVKPHFEGTIADAMAFDAWTPEQKRIARAGIVVETKIEKAREAAHHEGFEEGHALGEAEARRDAVNLYEDLLADVWAKLRLLIPQFAEHDTRLESLREVTEIVAKGASCGGR